MGDIGQMYLSYCEVYNWTPSVQGLCAYKRIVEAGLWDLWTAPTKELQYES